MKTLLLLIGLFSLSLNNFAQSKSEKIEITLLNTSSKSEIKSFADELKKNNLTLVASSFKIRAGKIIKIHLKLSFEKGKVEGTYSDFNSIKIFRDEQGQVGISPL